MKDSETLTSNFNHNQYTVKIGRKLSESKLQKWSNNKYFSHHSRRNEKWWKGFQAKLAKTKNATRKTIKIETTRIN